MSTTLDPRIAAKLDAFAHRRRRLIIFRGVCAAIAMLLGAMMLVAVIDWIFVLPDAARWGLSVAAYLAVIIVAWRAGGRLLLHAPDSRNLARLIENAEPSLREELLSAVELGQGSGEWDSEQFRALVQADVSHRVEGLQMERLLPAVLLKSAVVALVVMLLICFIAMVVPSLRFGALLVRALAPGANLDRVSSVQVKIIQPSPREMAVPQGDSVPLLVELTGRRVTKAYLETFTKSGGRAMVQLQPAPGGRFSAGIQVAREDVEYRVRAFDAITKKYHLTAAARPSVVGFHKEYTYPKYTGLPPKIVDEEGGDLAAVEGTEVALTVKTNQPVKVAIISVEAGHKTLEVPLEKRPDGQWAAKLPMKTAGVYRVELVSAATGFENKFNPEYELRVSPDTIPMITLQTPERDLIASANEVIGLTATATDDIALAKVEQAVKINDGKWVTRPLSDQRAAEVKIDERWDLFKQGVHPGDSVTTKLIATDCKGNKGESRPVSITIAASGFDRTRLEALNAERQLMKAVAEWQAATATLEQKNVELRKLIDGNAEVAKRKAALTEFTALLDQCTSLAAAAQAQIVTTIRLVTPGHETGNLVVLSRCLSLGEALQAFLPHQLQVTTVDPLPAYARDLSRLGGDTCAALGRRSKMATDAMTRFENAEEFDVISENLQVIVREQNRIATMAQNSGDDAAKWAALTGRMKVVLAEVENTENGMKEAAAVASAYAKDRLVRLQKRLTDQRTDAVVALAAPVPGKALLASTLNLARGATEATVAITEMKREQTQQAVSLNTALRDQVEPAWIGFERLRPEIDEIMRADKTDEAVRADLAGARWDGRAAIWKAYGDAEELRPDADAAWVKDLRSLRLAMDGVRDPLVTPVPATDRDATALTFTFKAIDGDPEKAEALGFQVNTPATGDGASFLKLGDLVPKTKFKLEKFEAKPATPGGTDTDASELTLTNTETGSPLVLVLNKPTEFLGPYATVQATWKRVTKVDQAFRVLEIAHDLTELANGFDLLGAAERYQSGGVRAKSGNLTDFLRLWPRLLSADNEINRTNLLDPATRKLTLEVKLSVSRIPGDAGARALDEEMRQRIRADRDPVLQAANSEKVAVLVRQALGYLRPAVDEARKVLKDAQPKLSERLAQLAKEAKNLQADNAEKAADKSEKPPEQARAEAKQNLAKQEKLTDKVDAVKDAIRAEANLQNILEKEGREKARDADDALAMLKDPPPRAEAALNDAVNAERPAEQKDALKAAANENQKLADALDQIAKHTEAQEKGDQAAVEESRLALREEEKKLGVKADLDAQYAKTEELAKTAEQSPEGMLAKLEKALEKNPLMRQELSNVSRELLTLANTQLAKATKDESAIAREVEKIAAAQPKPAPQPPQANANAPKPPANGEKPPGDPNAKPDANKTAAIPPANGEKPPGDPGAKPDANKTAANPPANGEKPPGDSGAKPDANKTAANPPANGEKPPGDPGAKPDANKTAANPPANGEKPPGDPGAKPDANKTAANPPANGEKSPGDPSAKPDANKMAANPPANGEKQPGDPGAKPDANKTAANPPANGEKPPGDPAAQPNPPTPAPANPALTKAAEQQKPIAKNANAAGEAVERAGRHEERLKNEKAGQELQKLGADVQATAQTQVPKAEQALAKGDAPAEAKDAVGAAEKELKDGLNRLTDAQSGQAPQTPPAAQPAGATPPAPAPNPAGAKPAKTAKADAGKPDAAKPDGAKPANTAKADGTAKPESGQPEGAKPDGANPAALAKNDAATPPAGAGANPPAGATPPGSAKPPGDAPAGQNPPGTPGGAPPGAEDLAAQIASNTPAAPQQQVWMARALDALDAALHANPAGAQPEPGKDGQANQQQGKPGQPGQPGQPQPGQGDQPGQDAQQAAKDAAAQAQKAMAAAGQAAAAEMRANRSPTPPGQPTSENPKGGEMAASKTGAKADAAGSAYGKLAGATTTATGSWGKLPKQMAEQLSQGSRESVSAEYQKEVETYYRVIAERARKNAQ